MYLIQLPDDVVPVGYAETKPFHHEQVFYSKSKDFTGTELAFLKAGYAYRYSQLGDHVRVVI